MKDGILHVEVWAEQSTEEQSSTAAAIKRRNQFSFTAPVRLQRRRALAHFRCQASEAVCCARQDMGAVRRAYTEANMEAEIQGQKLTEVITKLKGDLKTVAERNARLLRKMTEMQLLMTDASRKGLVSPQVRRNKTAAAAQCRAAGCLRGARVVGAGAEGGAGTPEAGREVQVHPGGQADRRRPRVGGWRRWRRDARRLGRLRHHVTQFSTLAPCLSARLAYW